MKLCTFLFLFLSLSPWAQGQEAKFGPEFEFESKVNEAMRVGCFMAPIVAYTGLVENLPEEKERALKEQEKLASALTMSTFGLGYLASDRCSEWKSLRDSKRLARNISKLCEARRDCHVEKVETHNTWGKFKKKEVYRVVYDDGFWFQLNTDTSVVEVQSKPMTVAEAKKIAPRLQRDLFETAQGLYLNPPTGQSGGHINIGFAEDFAKDPKLFRNFLADYLNHYEISEGVLNNDRWNADNPIRSSSRRKKLLQTFEEFDQGKYSTTEDFITALEEGPFKGKGRKLSLSVRRVNDSRIPFDEKTVELRAVRAQQEAGEFEILARLFQGRINFLKNQRDPIMLGEHKPLGKNEKLSRFQKYVTESGLSWEEVRALLPNDLAKSCKEAFGQLRNNP